MIDDLNQVVRQFQGHSCVELTLPDGDRAVVSLFGAQLLSWVTADGNERIYLSPRALADGSRPIRGGAPICFPQFNERVLEPVALPRHGFARTQTWSLRSLEEHSRWAEARFELTDTPQTRAIWPHPFAAACTVSLEPDNLRIGFDVLNAGPSPWPFAFALHTYLKVDDISRTELLGLQGVDYHDAAKARGQIAASLRVTQTERALRFSGETDRVYSKVRAPLLMRDGRGALRIEQSASLPDVVVWNPGAALCATIEDMPPAGFGEMLCVEAACVQTPQVLAPDELWRGWQSLRVMPEAFRPSGFAPL